MNRQHHPLYQAQTEAKELWRSADDRVMGGVSIAEIKPSQVDGASCICLSGKVSLENRGGFIQIQWPFKPAFDARLFSGVYFDAWGNQETYNLHLRTHQLWLPWQSFRASFQTSASWQRFYISFAAMTPYKTHAAVNLNRLKSLAIVAIGRVFTAEVCVKELGFYRDENTAISDNALR
jgi:hypothetical protein